MVVISFSHPPSPNFLVYRCISPDRHITSFESRRSCAQVPRSAAVIELPVIVWDALNARRLYIQLTVNGRQRKLTGTDVLIPCSQSSAGDLRVQLYRYTVPDLDVLFI